MALLDTGCEHSFIDRKLVSAVPLERQVYAANGPPNSFVGSGKGEVPGEIQTTVLVTEALEELILGIDWLATHRCPWDFGNRWIGVDGYVE